MDYDAQLIQSCPVEYVEMARAQDLTQFPKEETALHRAWGLGTEEGLQCVNALIAWFTPKINANSHPQNIGDWLGYLSGYRGTLPDDLRADVRKALLRIGYNQKMSKYYFLAMSTHKIDLRQELAQQIKPDWSFPDINNDYAFTWFYYTYLATMEEPGAYEALEKKVAQTTYGNAVYGMLDDLSKLKTKKARNILEKYKNDSRDLVGPSGTKSPLREVIPMMIQLTKWN